MKYMLLIYQNPSGWETLTEEERSKIMNDATDIFNELNASGQWIGGEGLADSSQTKTIRVRDGVPAVTDGPFLEAKEQLAGYGLFECDSLQDAIDIGTRWPDARHWAVEIRPLMGQDAPEI